MRLQEPAVVVNWVAERPAPLSTRAACGALTIPRSWYYRQRATREVLAKLPAAQTWPTPAQAPSQAERAKVRAVLNSERLQDEAPRTVHAALLEKGTTLYHWWTMYRVLSEQGKLRERRRQQRRPQPARQELVARAVNDVWSWDITRLPGLGQGLFFYLYVMLDLFSRYIVGWVVAEAETAALASHSVTATCHQQQIRPDQLTIHSDRGSPMRTVRWPSC